MKEKHSHRKWWK